VTGSPPTARSAEVSRRSFLARASALTAAGTVLSRATGLARLVVIAAVLGQTPVADAFNLANTTPNVIHDLVLGGVLAATFVPVFIDRLSHNNRRAAERSISSVLTVSLLLLVVATLLFELAAPWIIDLYSIGARTHPDHQLAVTLLRYFAPQLFFYGVISLIAAVLATQDRFVAVGFAPIVNNVISIGVLIALGVLAHEPSQTLGAHPGYVAFLGIGTTVGVALQAIVLLPSLWRSGLRLRFRFDLQDSAIGRILSLSGWTFGIVLANQIAVFLVLALAYHASGKNGAGVSAYTYAYTFFQFPFGVAAASIINVATPDLARAWAERNLALVGKRFGTATRQVLAVILPATVGYLVLAPQAVTLIIAHGAETVVDAQTTASVLELFAIGLPAYCVFFLAVRTFQAMQDTRSAFICYAVENVVNIVVALATYQRLGVEGLALSYSVAYGVGVVIALIMLRARLGTIGGRSLAEAAVRAIVLSILMAIVVAAVSAATGKNTGIIGWIELVVAVAAGLGAYLVGAGVAGTLTARKPRHRGSTREATNGSRDRHGLGERPASGTRGQRGNPYRPARGPTPRPLGRRDGRRHW
jgi:putative peptidoglycan lipid II flippase